MSSLPVFGARCRYLDAANCCQGTHRAFRFPGMGEVPPYERLAPGVVAQLCRGYSCRWLSWSSGQPHGAHNTGNSSMAFSPAILHTILILAVLNYVMDSCIHSLYTFKLHKVEIHLDYHSWFHLLIISLFYRLSDVSSLHFFYIYTYIIPHSVVV